MKLFKENNVLAGHEVVRLPVAHCELNPIEMAWSQVKGYVKEHNKKYLTKVIFLLKCFERFTLTEVQRLVHEGFSIVTPERWQSLIKRVEEKVENHYWEHDGHNEELLERFIINTSSDSSDSNISDSGEDNGSMEESDSAEDVSVLK